MRIGILTLPLHTNYGGILQAYALQNVLERMGHDVKVINRPQSFYLPPIHQILAYAKRFIYKFFLRRSNIVLMIEKENAKNYHIISCNTQKFIDQHIKLYNVKSYTKLRERDFDAIIVGSDQVWRLKYFDCYEDAYLKFAEKWKIKRLSYAASFGTDKWEYSAIQTQKCKQLLEMFDAISVRENSAISMIRQHFNLSAIHVLDPTMLLTADDYTSLASSVPKSPGNLMYYILDDDKEKMSFIDDVCKKKGLVKFRIGSSRSKRVPLPERIQPPVEQWLRGFMDAEFVITDSFHAVVFSIIFRKPFVVLGNKERGLARFESILNMFGLEHHLLQSPSEYDSSVDYTIPFSVYHKLELWKENSMAFLKKNLQ